MSIVKGGLFWGLLLGLSEVACIQVLTWAGLGLSHLTWILTYVLVVILAITAGLAVEKGSAQRLGILNAAVLVLVMVLVSRVIYQTYMFVYINYLDPGWVETVATVWREQLRQGGANEETIAANISQFRREWETVHIFTYGIINYGIAHYILALFSVVVVVCRPWRLERRKEQDFPRN
jgi:hypothetical protein